MKSELLEIIAKSSQAQSAPDADDGSEDGSPAPAVEFALARVFPDKEWVLSYISQVEVFSGLPLVIPVADGFVIALIGPEGTCIGFEP